MAEESVTVEHNHDYSDRRVRTGMKKSTVEGSNIYLLIVPMTRAKMKRSSGVSRVPYVSTCTYEGTLHRLNGIMPRSPRLFSRKLAWSSLYLVSSH